MGVAVDCSTRRWLIGFRYGTRGVAVDCSTRLEHTRTSCAAFLSSKNSIGVGTALLCGGGRVIRSVAFTPLSATNLTKTWSSGNSSFAIGNGVPNDTPRARCSDPVPPEEKAPRNEPVPRLHVLVLPEGDVAALHRLGEDTAPLAA